MAKKKSAERGKVTLGVNDLSNETHMFLQRLDDVVSQCGDSMLITKLAEIVDAIKTECGEDAKVSVHIDDFYGNHVDITWYRPETDEEWAKRLEANKNKAAGQRKKRATDKAKKEIDERAQLARLQKKYAEEG